MIFFVGTDRLTEAWKLSATFISANTLWKRQVGFPVRRWVMDSGGYTALRRDGDYRPSVEYAALIRRFAANGALLAAVSQDYMCEPELLEKTGRSVAQNQRDTIDRYDELLTHDCGGVRIMPVLQGHTAADCINHLRQYGSRLLQRAWVGVGSIAKGNPNPDVSKPAAVEAILLAIRAERPDLRLHGFGLRLSALRLQLVRDLLFSADSMAWHYEAWRLGRPGHNMDDAVEFARRISSMPTQLALGVW